MDNNKCGIRFLYLTKFINKQHIFAFVPARCKSWSCLTCRRVKSKIIKTFIQNKFKGESLWLMSLTYFHTGSPETAWSNIGKTVNRLLSYAHKMHGNFNYIRIVEPHADGNWPHIHILINKDVMDNRFVKLVTSWGFGWNFHSKMIDCKSSSVYLSKYLSKPWPIGQGNLLRIITKTRLVSASRSLGAIFTKNSEWDCISYDKPSKHTEFYFNQIIHSLKDKGAGYIMTKTFGPGFIIKSDIEISISDIESCADPYIWKACVGYDYNWIPYGLQQDLFSNEGWES